MKDELDWRTEGTKANLRVEYLMNMANRWDKITATMIYIAWAEWVLVVYFELIKKCDWMLFVLIAQVILAAACYARLNAFSAKLKVWTEDE